MISGISSLKKFRTATTKCEAKSRLPLVIAWRGAYISDMRPLGGVLLAISLCFGAFERVPFLPLQVAAGSVFQTVGGSPNMFTDPSSLLRVGGVQSSMITSTPFGIAQLADRTWTIASSHRLAHAGLSAQIFGLALYRETTVAVAAARKIGRHLEVGLRLSAHQIDIKNYGAHRTVTVSGSMTYPLSETARWSLHGLNLNAPRLGRSEEPLPQIMAMGFQYAPAGPLQALVEIEKDLSHRERTKFGLIWEATPWLTLASGFSTNPAQMSAGLSLKLFRLAIDYAIATHPHLPETHTLALHLRFR